MRTQALTLMNTAMYRKLAPPSDAFAHAVSGAKLFFYTAEMSCDTQAKPKRITSTVIVRAGC
jgi:hypothetical protein